MAPLSLTLLGGFRARLDGDQPLVIPIKKAQALLAYLALPLGQAHSREKLAALLWGDMRDAQARAGLRQALFALRKVLGTSSPLRMVGETMGLDPGCVVVDVAAFEQRVADGTRDALEDVAALYQGDLLEGLTLQEAPFEEWMLAERLRLREMAVEALGRLLSQQREMGAADAGIRTAVRLIALDPLQEGVHRTLMRLHAQMGRRGAALRQYQLCVAALHRELRAEPDDETRALYQQILQRQPMTAPPAHAADPGAPGPPPAEWLHAEGPPGETALVGRDREMGALRGALASAFAGQGRVVAVSGEAGIGKSRLVAELVGEANGKGVRLLLGRCYETEQVLPFGPWINALRAGRVAADAETLERLGPVWRAELARLLPETAPGTSPGAATPDHAQLFEGVAQLLERAASAHPVLLVFEDLHWADEMSLRLLAFAARRLHRCRLLIVGTVRDEDLADAVLLRHTLDEIERDRHLARVSLAVLSREDTAALARMLVSPSAAARLEVPVWTASLGNPFMVVETLRALGGGEPPGDAPSLPLSDRVRDLITHRLERLGDRARRLLAVAAVVGRPFEFALLQRASDLSESDAAEGVEELVRHRVLHGAGEGLEFTHDRVRELVYGELLPARRVLLHRRVAEALEHLHADALERYALALGTHYREGEAWGPAVVHLGRAGRLASMRYAKRDAIACYEEALGALAHLPEGRQTDEHAAELRFFFAHALFAVGQLERAKESFRLAESLAVALEDHRRLAQIHAGMTYLLGSEAAFEAATQSGVRAITIAASLGDLGLEVWAGIGLGRVYFGQGSYRAAIERMRRVAEALKDSPADERFGRGSIMPSVACRAWLALGLGHVGEFAEAIAWGADGVRIADEVAGPIECAWAYYCLGAVHLERGDADLAAPFFERAMPLCTDGRLPIYAPRVLAGLGAAHVARGRVDDGIALLEQAVRDAEATKLRYGHATILIQTGEAHLAAGRLDEAQAHARAALDLARAQGARGDEARALELHGALAERGGREDAAGALAGVEAACALAQELGMAPLHARGRLTLGRLYRRLGREEEAARESTHGETLRRAMRMEPPPTRMARPPRVKG